jgi:hypothetical protein
VIDLVRAAVGTGSGRLLVLEPPAATLRQLGRPGETLVVACAARKTARACRERSAADEEAALVVLQADPARLPFKPRSFDALVSMIEPAPSLPIGPSQRLVRAGGVVVLASRVRTGLAGGAASIVRHARRGPALPRAGDLTAWLLRAGLRSVRQATAPGSVVVTWAEVRPRPWEG